MGGGGRPAAACALGPPGSPQGTPWGRLCGCPLPPGASALGWAKNSRGGWQGRTLWEAGGGGAGRGGSQQQGWDDSQWHAGIPPVPVAAATAQ